ncbi:hypothetical protein [Maritimibacter sp. DP1N21-5]|uniref:hypothetical protein n=1 Tax=Maritimibacter sp. DP1N21-5 TaxID=2836867 RepID=UPI001C4898BE|nr:hypothetical protein [Maritimibacter sp. DP1N21-5]MBV7407722.1 hypothetical protein [Maritimibacter sp. DP1N21-5]
MTQTILTLTVAYALVAVIVVLVVLNSRFPLVLKAGLTVAIAALMFLTYQGIGRLRGLPSDTAPPERFRLYWAQIEEPDKLTGDPGAIFLWLGELDEDYYPVGQPRAHRLPYSDELAALVLEAQGKVAKGEDISGEVAEEEGEEDPAEDIADDATEETEQGNNARIGTRVVNFDFGGLRFDQTPAPVTPDKDN